MGSGLIKAGIGCLLVAAAAFILWHHQQPSLDGKGAGHGFVYRVEWNGNTHYLAGSLHVLRPGDYPLPAPYAHAFEASERLLFELETNGQASGSVAGVFAAAGLFPSGDGRRLDASISPELYRRVRACLEKQGREPSSLDRHRPWYAAMALTAGQLAAVGAQAEFGVDRYFRRRAEKRGMWSGGLESVQEQVSLFVTLDRQEATALLEAAVEAIEDGDDRIETLIGSWKGGDALAMERLLRTEGDRNRDLMAKMNGLRNARWIESLKEALGDRRPTMVLVGTGHLLGEGGLVNRLREKGANVVRVKNGD